MNNRINNKIKILYIGSDEKIKKLLKLYSSKHDIIIIRNINKLFKLKNKFKFNLILLDSRIKLYQGIVKYFKSIKTLETKFIILLYHNNRKKKLNLLSFGNIEDCFIIPNELSSFKIKLPIYLEKLEKIFQYNELISQIDVVNTTLETVINTIDANFSLMESIINILVFGFISTFKESYNLMPEYLLLGRRFKLKEEGYIFSFYRITEDGFPHLKKIFFEKYNDLKLDFSYIKKSEVVYINKTKKIKKNSKILRHLNSDFDDFKDAIYFINDDIIFATFNNRMPIDNFVKFTFHTFAIQANLLNLAEINLRSLRNSYSYTTETLARAAEASDELTGDHIMRVAYYSIFMANKMGLSRDFSENLYNGAKLHDIGKIHIPQSILRKNGPLTENEWEIMKQHTIFGAYIIGEADFLKTGKIVALQHHENFDGTGYPYGLKEKEISLEARIVKLADVYDSLRSPRPYKEGFSHKKALKIILEGDNRVNPSHFDPEILKIFEKYNKNFEKIYDKLHD